MLTSGGCGREAGGMLPIGMLSSVLFVVFEGVGGGAKKATLNKWRKKNKRQLKEN